MTSPLRLSVQENLVPGANLETRFENAVAAGFDGLELRASADGSFRARLAELTAAVSAGVVISSVCMDLSTRYLGSFSSEDRLAARADVKDVLAMMADVVPGIGLVVPNGCAVFSTYLPPFTPPVTRHTAEGWLQDGLTELATFAGQRGAQLFLEPLNRYEDWVVNTLGQAATLIAAVGSPHLGVCLDTFHAQIEESDLAAAIRATGPALHHVQLGDSNRLEPGLGHLDWGALITGLHDIDYQGWLAMECFVSEPGLGPLRTASRTIRAAESALNHLEKEK